jgi:MtN3 and saliva related transmembrane protein
MAPEFIDALGILAGSLFLIGYVPQILKSYRTRSLKDLSLGWLSLFAIGSALWVLYGIFRLDNVLILVNSVGLVQILSLVIMKIIFEHRTPKINK